MDKPDLVVGIDFGMTCTGVAYANLTRGETVRWISKWPTRAQAHENKVPTIIVYPKGSHQPSSWGFGSEAQTERDDDEKEYVEWFKTYLDPGVLEQVRRRDPEFAPKSHEDVQRWYEDYLRLLYQHIEHKFGSELPAHKPWNLARIEFIFGLPTTWQTYPTVEMFRSIIERAGYERYRSHSIILGLTEPEAAAVYTSVDAPGMFQENDVVAVCDAGGGTTDLSVLRITGVHHGTVSLKQLDVVVGKNIGSVAIDRQFEDYVLSQLQQAVRELGLDIDPIESAWNMMKSREYQNAKCDYGSPDMTPVFVVPIPGINPTLVNERFQIKNGAMKFDSAQLQRMFDSQIERLFAEIDKQLQSFEQKFPGEGISHLVLSGGLGNSAYVQERLNNRYAFGQSSFSCARNIHIHVAPDPQLAVCKGIVIDRMRQLQSGKAVLGWRCARASYGTIARIPYNAKNPEHFNKQAFRDPLNGKYYIHKGIVWFIKKGEPVNVDEPIKHKFAKKIQPGDPRRAFETEVVTSDLDKQYLPLQMNDHARILCEVKSDLSGADETKFKKKNRHWWSRRKPYYRIDYQISTIIGPADLRFELWFDGQKLNKDNPIKVDWQASPAPQQQPDDPGLFIDEVTTLSLSPPKRNASV